MRVQHFVEPGAHAFRLLLGDRIGVGAKLQIDAPDVVRLAMHQGRLAGMEFRREPEAAFGRKIRRHAHVGDQELVLEGDAGEAEAKQAATVERAPSAAMSQSASSR